MCGLAGLFLPRAAAPATADLDAMLAVMRHRGPDGTGRHVSADRRFQAGFARLAIIDLVTGDQPLVEGDGERVLLGNGEIYNYRELRTELAGRGHAFRTSGDMEPALRLFAEQGTAFVHALNGMYGLAVYDRAAHRLVLVRDRLGIKPLYWSRLAGGGILFASEIKALFASGLIRPEVDDAAVAPWLAHGYVPAPHTLWRNVAKLPPGHLLVAEDDGTVRLERYWRPQPTAALPPGEERDRLLALLDDAVRLQLRSDVPVSAMLSGGIDSGLIVALAARRMERPLSTYTVRFVGAAVDESPLAAEVAARYGTRHTTIDLDPGRAAALLPRLAWFADEPLADATLLPGHLINAELARETRVVLNGTGGDELFAGYGRYFPLPVENRWLRLPAAIRGAGAALADLGDPYLAWQLRRAEKFAGDRGGYLHDHSTLFPPPVRRRLGSPGDPAAAQARYFAEFAGPADTGMLYADLCTYLPEDLLTLLDRTTMASGVEGRVPFLDHRLVEAALAVPPAVRCAGGRQKALERAMAADLLPASVLSAPKQGFASPVPAWFRGPLAGQVRRLLTRPGTLARGWWSKAGIDRLLADPGRHAFRLYALTMLELTVRLHADLARAAPPDCSLAELTEAS
jgi:asparagine synthase (glutamine-hydrolysing)